jgi:hypothetical protein
MSCTHQLLRVTRGSKRHMLMSVVLFLGMHEEEYPSLCHRM